MLLFLSNLNFYCRLAGAAFVVPMINYNWRSLPNELTKDDYRKNLARWALWVSRYTPGLVYWWFTQKMFPSSTVIDRNPAFFNDKDLEVLKNTPGFNLLGEVKLCIFYWHLRKGRPKWFVIFLFPLFSHAEKN